MPHYIKVLGYKVLIVQTGRGCPHGCDFCAVTAFNGRCPRHWPVEWILKHVEKWLAPGDFVVFIDDNIVVDRHYAETLFQGLIRLRKKGRRVRWFTQTDVRIVLDDHLRKLAVKSGLAGAFFGIEDPNAAILGAEASRWKAAKSAQYEEVFRLCRKNFIASLAAMIIGWDADTKKSVEEKIEWAIRMGPDLTQWTLLTPFVGSKFWNQLKNSGRMLKRSYDFYDAHHAVYRHPNLTVTQREKAIRTAYNRFCSGRNLWPRLIRNSFRWPTADNPWPVRSLPINAGVYVMNRNAGSGRLWKLR